MDCVGQGKASLTFPWAGGMHKPHEAHNQRYTLWICVRSWNILCCNNFRIAETAQNSQLISLSCLHFSHYLKYAFEIAQYWMHTKNLKVSKNKLEQYHYRSLIFKTVMKKIQPIRIMVHGSCVLCSIHSTLE